MKKIWALFLALSLALAGTAAAEKTVEGKWGQKTVFSITYDEKRFSLDTEQFRGEDTDYTRYQFALYDDLCFLTCFIDYCDWMAGFSSYLADEEEMRLYAEDALTAYDGVKVEVVEIYSVEVKKGKKEAKLPFLILRMEEGGEVMYQAELVSHGYCIVMNCGAQNSGYAAEKLLRTLKSCLDTFVPISQ